MQKSTLLTTMLMAMAMQQMYADTVQSSTKQPGTGTPEHVYTMVSGNNYFANGITAPTQTEANYGKFAFYPVDGKSGAYYVYSITEGKWLTYAPSSSYPNKTKFIGLNSTRDDACYFRLNNYSGDFYEILPYTTSGTTAGKYLNWYRGIGNDNPLDGDVTLGLWEDGGAQDGGSRWTFTELVQRNYDYKLTINGADKVTIGGKEYSDGATYHATESLTKNDIVVPAVDGKFAVVSINDVEQTVKISYADIPQQAESAGYTNAVVYPEQQTAVGKASATEANGAYTLSNNVLAASFVKVDGALYFGGSKAMNLEAGTEPFTVAVGNGLNVPASAMTLKSLELEDLIGDENAVGGAEHYDGKALVADYEYKYGDATLHIAWKAVLRDGSHYLRTEMKLTGDKDVKMYNVIPLTYNVDTKAAGSAPQVVGNTRGAILLSDKIFAGLENPVGYNTVSADGTFMQGLWSRNTTLKQDDDWKISAVVGLVAQDGTQDNADIHSTQKRRSFLAYSERERAVPWRANPVYISWYELNIDRNNAADPTKNMNANQVVDVVNHWKSALWDKYGVAPNSFVIDDGWDNYGTWTFHSGFPNEMRDIASLAAEMKAGVGAWLGPVGGYGTSGDYRRNYWKNNGGMVLSNPAYYKVFLDAATNLTRNNGDFRFFKFDGISAQGTAVGPDPGDTGNENAEGIIRLERYIRENLKRDIFFNTTVGTWASPFWYHYSDATWRQDADYKEIAGSNTSDRERWVTYRDKQVYDIYITASPVCPINTLMTHGFILSSHGQVSKDMSYDACLREMRCAFACGSGMVELYTDYDLLNSINNGKLWEDLAECIEWQKKNADVLPDAHWVGGNPWDGSKTSVYGWASWNGKKATLALRNGGNSSAIYHFTLREALNIPDNVSGTIVLSKSFKVQNTLTGLTEDKPINIDTVLTVTLPGSSVFCFDGIDSNATAIKDVTAADGDNDANATAQYYDLGGSQMPAAPSHGVYIMKNGKSTQKVVK